METTLICAGSRRRALEIAGDRSIGREQDAMRGNGEWAYVGSMRDIFGRPSGLRILIDETATRLNDWKAILNYIAQNDYRCEWIGNWIGNWNLRIAPALPDGPRTGYFVRELQRIGYCVVCRKPMRRVFCYETPGLLNFDHGNGRECRVAIDMQNLDAAVRTVIRAAWRVANGAQDIGAILVGERREWLGPGLYEEQARMKEELANAQRAKRAEEKERWIRETLARRAQLERAQQASLEQIAKLNKGAQQANPIFTGAALPTVVQRNTIRKVKFD